MKGQQLSEALHPLTTGPLTATPSPRNLIHICTHYMYTLPMMYTHGSTIGIKKKPPGKYVLQGETLQNYRLGTKLLIGYKMYCIYNKFWGVYVVACKQGC